MGAALWLCAATGAWAQPLPSAPQPFIEQQRQQERERALREQQERAVDVRLPTAPERAAGRLPESEAPCFRIDRLVLEGERADGFQWLLREAAGEQSDDTPIGRCLGSQAAGNAAANNWLAAQQRAQMKREMDAAKSPTDKLQVFGKWALISGKQDVLTASGVGKGLVEAGISDVQGLAEFLAHPVEGLNGLKQIISSPEARQQVGDSVFAELDAKIARMQTALEVGGDQNAEQLGKDFGNLVWNVGSVLMGAGAAAKGGVALARAGVSIGANTLETAAFQFMKLDAGAIKGFKSAEEINALMNAAEGWSPAWKSGTSVAEVTVKPGTTVKMVVNEKSWNAIKQGDFDEAFGGLATFDDVPNARYAGNQLAMTSALTGKSGALYVVEVQVARSINAQVGIVGPQGLSTGGGNQLHFFIPRDDRSKFFNYVANSGRAL